MKPAFWGTLLAVGAVLGCPVLSPAAGGAVAWRDDFDTLSSAWRVKSKPGTPAAIFTVTNGYLEMTSASASATLATEPPGVDLNKDPILQWSWRVTAFPPGADGRDPSKDDQAIGIYVTTGNMFSQKSIAYRWETVTPVGAEGDVTYGGGLVKVHWICVRNQQDAASGQFLAERRDVAADFKRIYGLVPERVGVGISCNSQYTASKVAAQLDWIQFGAP